jgi:hypothetical protein
MVVNQLPPNRSAQPELKIMDSVGLVAVVLAIASMLLDNMLAIGVLLALAAVIICYTISKHSEIPGKYRAAGCLLCTLALVALFSLLLNAHNARELEKNEGLLVPAHHKRPTTRCNVSDDDFAIYA